MASCLVKPKEEGLMDGVVDGEVLGAVEGLFEGDPGETLLGLDDGRDNGVLESLGVSIDEIV